MVKASFRLVAVLAITLPVLSLSAKDLGEYQIGDRADEDIVATTRLSVIDPEGTQAMKEKEAMRVPAVVRYYTNAGDDLEAQFRDTFTKTRADFLDSVNKAFGHRKLSAEELGSSKFDTLAMLFQKQNKLFPLTPNRAALWASGDDDSAYQASLALTLRQMVGAPIRPEPLPEDIRIGYTVRLVALGNSNFVLTAQNYEHLSKSFSRSNFVTLADVKKNFQNLFSKDEREEAKYLTTLLKPNCVLEEELTRQLRAKRTDGLWSLYNYETGQVIARRGQVIDGKVKAALDQLKEKTMVGQLQDLQTKQQDLQAKQQAAVGQLQQLVATDAQGAQTQAHLRWIIGALAGVVLLLALAIWQLARRRQAVSLLPVSAANAGALEWQQRALVAEQRSDQLQTAARAGLIAHLSQWMTRVLTQRLLSQRRVLIENQTNAAEEMAQLEERLSKVQAPLQVRLAAYEHRIAELEKELAVRGEENRELLKAKIEMMRKQLETEREKENGKNRLEFN